MYRKNYWKLCLSILLLIAVVLSACTGVKQPQERSTVSPTNVKAATHTPNPPPTRTAVPMATPSTSPTATLQPPLLDAQLRKDSILGVRWGVAGNPDYVALGDGTAYLVDLSILSERLEILSAETGQEVWAFQARADHMLSYTFTGQRLILGESAPVEANKARLQAYETPSIKLLWETGEQFGTLSNLEVEGEWLFVGERTEYQDPSAFSLVDLRDGWVVWRATCPDDCWRPYSFTIIENGATVRMKCLSKTFYFNMLTGEQIDRQAPVGDKDEWLMTDSGSGVFYDVRNVTEMETAKRDQIPHYSLDSIDRSNPRAPKTLWSLPFVGDYTHVEVYAGDAVIRSRNLVLRADRLTGQIVWQTEVSGYAPSSLAVVGNRVIAGSEVGFLSLLDADTGKLLWEQDIWGSIEPRYISIYPIALSRDGLLVHARSRDAGRATLMLGLNGLVQWPTPPPLPEASSTPTPAFTPPAPGVLPPPPDDLEDWASAMLSFLNADPGNLAAFDRLMQSWVGPLRDDRGWSEIGLNFKREIKTKQADLTGDGVDELIVVFSTGNELSDPGLVAVLRPDASRQYRAIYNAPVYNPKLETVADLDRDWQYELVYSQVYFDGSDMETTVIPLKWNGQALVDMSGDAIRSTWADLVQVRNAVKDAQVEILIRGGWHSSSAAGPARFTTDTYGLVDGRYRLLSKKSDHADSYYFLVTDAHNAFMAGDLYEAIRMFTYALTSPEAQALIDDWGFQDEEAKHAYADPMKAFAEYQLMLAYIQKGDEDKAAEWALTGHYPDMLYSQVKTVFWNTYQQTHDWTQAAEAARTQARLAGYEAMQLIQFLGYANEGLDLEDVCPCPQCRQGSIE